ncbi:ABC transporter permease [Pseudocitrobacter sp. 2023EL-00150]|nr:ABC transporter permease [Pseudocitrobacter sp. 2023EL-00150]EFH7310434.1 ABC transporter permease [Escherichia coli]MDF3830704.1 ABC transporter permease [Pseudocitrobacter sp. 2023EL-00150]HDT6516830.1 ABC transporter permease [Citrobacter freundii]
MTRSGIEIQRAVVKALFLRETRTRFGKFRLSYLWAILSPSAHLIMMLFIFGYVMHRTMPDISFPIFLVNGIIPYFIFSDIAVRSLKAIEANKGLFNYRPVKPIDTIIARALLETMIYIMVYAVMMGVLWLVGEEFSLARMLLLICTWFLLVILSCGIGLIFMIIGSLYPESEKFLPIIIKPFYFISCVMFPLHAVPKDYWPYLLWNPLVHVVELSREAVVENYISDGVELSYLAFCSLVVFFVGLISYRLLEESVLTSS